MKSSKKTLAAPAARLRCAIYTRKSSEEGLEQSFNSLDAQREACEAYIMSQAGEGWSGMGTPYDDGGYSGGTMERPGLKQLLADIALRKIDIIVVYKVDRLTRSLADFAKMVELLDEHGVSFVSVTQAFNTTSSMGRLTLNVLLSFAQFEREVTGERIRDKISASKKKGMWMGGTPPLGYRGHERTLVIDETEAATVRHIFERYLMLRSVHALKDELIANGIRSRVSKRTGGELGAPFGRGALYHLLSNRIYVGEIVHKGESYPGLHPAIVGNSTFEQVAGMLATNSGDRKAQAVTADRAPLTGLIVDGDGRPLCPVSARNARGRLYRYYVSSHLQRGGTRSGDSGMRLSAPAIETLVLEKLSTAVPRASSWEAARQLLVRVTIHEETVSITSKTAGRLSLKSLGGEDIAALSDDGLLNIRTPMRLPPWGGSSEVSRQDGHSSRRGARIDRSLVRGLGRAHALVQAAKAAPGRSLEELAAGESAAPSYIRRLSRLAFLAPTIQQAILEGLQPVSLSLEKLMRMDLPLAWSKQHELLGFPSA